MDREPLYVCVRARRRERDEWVFRRVCGLVCAPGTVFTLDVGAFEDHDNLEHLLGPADGVSTDTLDVAQELIKQHEPSKGTTHLHVKCQYFSIQPCKQADKRNKIALPPGTCPPSEDGKKYYWSARCGEYSLCCTWLQSVGARLADLIRLATNSLRTPRNFTERQWSVVRDNAVAARYLTVNIDREIQEVLDRPHINFRLAAAQTRKALGAEQYLVLKYQWKAQHAGGVYDPSNLPTDQAAAGAQRQPVEKARVEPYGTPPARSHAQQCLLAQHQQQQDLQQASQAATGVNPTFSPAAQLLAQGLAMLGSARAAAGHCMVPLGQQIPLAPWRDIQIRLPGQLVIICEGEDVPVQPKLQARQLQLVQSIAAGATSTVYCCGLPHNHSTPMGSSIGVAIAF